MDKKTLMAFVLIIAVFLFYPTYMKWLTGGGSAVDSTRVAESPPIGQLKEYDQGAPGTTIKPVPERPTPAKSGPARALVAAAVESGAEELIEVVTPLYKAVLTTRGGNLTEWTLAKFTLPEDGLVSLLRSGDNAFLNLRLQTGQGPVPLDQYNFEVNRKSLELSGEQEGKIVFRLPLADGGIVTKEYAFRADEYACLLRVEMRGLERLFGDTRDYWLGLGPGLNSTESDQKTDRREFRSMSYMGGKPVQHNLGDVKDNKTITDTGRIAWAGLRTKYFLAAVAPREGELAETRSWGDTESLAMEVRRRGTASSDSFLVYMGPLDYDLLEAYGVRLEEAIYLGWRWIRPISHVILDLLTFLHSFIPNYGVVIIIFSTLIKILFYPLSLKSLDSMKRMQQLQPQIADLRQKHKNNPQQLNKAMMGLYKTNKVNPMGGCLPMLLQLPVFVALYAVLYHNIELRGAGFVLWIDDLSRKDPYFVLPILMGITMFVQQKMSQMSDPRQAMMTYLMPIIFTWFFLKFPSGLVLYWLVNNLLQIAQQKMMKPKPLVTAMADAGGGGNKRS